MPDFSICENEGQTVTGYPQMYAIRDNKIHIAYIPNNEYVITLYYLRSLAGLSATGARHALDVALRPALRGRDGTLRALRRHRR